VGLCPLSDILKIINDQKASEIGSISALKYESEGHLFCWLSPLDPLTGLDLSKGPKRIGVGYCPT
jgi:hypothetical protein